MPRVPTIVGVIIGLAFIAASILVVGRYQMIPQGDIIYRMDRWSGKIELCARIPNQDTRQEAFTIQCPLRF